jgi:hypothetical protein
VVSTYASWVQVFNPESCVERPFIECFSVATCNIHDVCVRTGRAYNEVVTPNCSATLPCCALQAFPIGSIFPIFVQRSSQRRLFHNIGQV